MSMVMSCGTGGGNTRLTTLHKLFVWAIFRWENNESAFQFSSLILNSSENKYKNLKVPSNFSPP